MVILLSTCVLALSPQSKQPSPSEQEVRQAENNFIALMKQPDREKLFALFADDFMQNNQFGNALNKDQYLRNVISGALKFDAYSTTGVNIRVYGDTAIVTGIEIMKGNMAGDDRTGQKRFSRVYIKQGGTWRLANNHLTNLALGGR